MTNFEKERLFFFLKKKGHLYQAKVQERHTFHKAQAALQHYGRKHCPQPLNFLEQCVKAKKVSTTKFLAAANQRCGMQYTVFLPQNECRVAPFDCPTPCFI